MSASKLKEFSVDRSKKLSVKFGRPQFEQVQSWGRLDRLRDVFGRPEQAAWHQREQSPHLRVILLLATGFEQMQQGLCTGPGFDSMSPQDKIRDNAKAVVFLGYRGLDQKKRPFSAINSEIPVQESLGADNWTVVGQLVCEQSTNKRAKIISFRIRCAILYNNQYVSKFTKTQKITVY
jgi:hypothetical protein